MSASAMGRALKLRHIDTYQTVLLVCIANRLNKGQDEVWVGQETMARECKLSKRTIIRSLKDLEDRGYIDRKRRWRKNGSRTSDRIAVMFADEHFVETTAKVPTGHLGQGASQSPAKVPDSHYQNPHLSDDIVEGAEGSGLGEDVHVEPFRVIAGGRA